MSSPHETFIPVMLSDAEMVEVEVIYVWGFNAKVVNSWKVVEGKKKWVPKKQIQFEEEVYAVSTVSRPCPVAVEKGSVAHNSYEPLNSLEEEPAAEFSVCHEIAQEVLADKSCPERIVDIAFSTVHSLGRSLGHCTCC